MIFSPVNIQEVIIFGGKLERLGEEPLNANPNILLSLKKKKIVRIMVDVKRVKLKLGAIFGLIGSIILLIVGLGSFTMYSYIYNSGNIPIFIPYIPSIVTSAISALGMYGAVIVFRDDFTGYTCLLLAGIIGIISSFIPIYIYIDEWDWAYTFYLSRSGGYIDLVFMLVGGILGFALAEKKERKE